jgi:Domain of unknown function (DUF1906)
MDRRPSVTKRERRRDARAGRRRLRLGSLILLTLLVCTTVSATASTSGTRVVSYHGYRVLVPSSWPVYDLTSAPAVCVRFNRHAVYLGRPSSVQRCPAHVVGRTEAILVEPLAAQSAAGSANAPALPPASSASQPRAGSLSRHTVAAHGVLVTATWGTHPGIVERALGIRSVSALTPSPVARASALRAHAAAAAAPGAVYRGLGFDPCSAPSRSQMSAWASSPYRAIGVYIGGTNMGCSQPNLTASWVSAETAAGWHLIPTYVGLQAPSNTCGCAPIDVTRASGEGAAAAADAIARAKSVGIEAGNPIYLDMEAYSRGGTNTSTVLSFLSAWTSRLHAGGYKSGVYSSGASGIEDLVARVGTGFKEPDDLWIADWNGRQATSDPYVPGSDWASHRRLHQYDGGHDETYRGVTINIDGDYLDGQTAAAGQVAQPAHPRPPVAPPPSPKLKVSPAADGTIHLYPSWTGVTDVAGWRILAGTNSSPLAPLGGSFPDLSPQTSVAERSTFPYFAVQALGSAGQVLSTSEPVATPAHVALYGHTMFSASSGLGGLPAGCFTGKSCLITTTISVGRTVIAETGPEFIPAGGGGVLYFKLSPTGRAMLAQSRGRRLSTRVTAREASGASATSGLELVGFSTSGRGPRRTLKPSSSLRIVGTTDFVSSGQVGGVLAGCFASGPCHPTTTITVGHTVIARTGPEFLGANSLGYLSFSLTPQGHAMLARAQGNQLGAHVTITDGTTVASAVVALVGFR